MGRNDWTDTPTLKAPFAVFNYGNEFVGDWFAVLDGEGRHITYDFHAEKFMNELCAVMNENSERLVKAWKQDVENEKRNKKLRKWKRTSSLREKVNAENAKKERKEERDSSQP